MVATPENLSIIAEKYTGKMKYSSMGKISMKGDVKINQ
jgi:hypothetical protein